MVRIRQALLVVAVAAASVVAGTAAPAKAAPVGHAVVAQPVAATAAACSRGYYKNVSGRCVKRPGSDPSGATAHCRDGTYSYSQHASGTCSHHRGVARWIHHP